MDWDSLVQEITEDDYNQDTNSHINIQNKQFIYR
jgi:hypothetical protein